MIPTLALVSDKVRGGLSFALLLSTGADRVPLDRGSLPLGRGLFECLGPSPLTLAFDEVRSGGFFDL